MDFFTPIVDDPHAYGAIAAANALSDIYAMGGKPITAMNIACFDPTLAEPEVWAAVFRGMADKCAEAGVAVIGGHSVEDSQPKFGLSVTGLIDPKNTMANAGAKPGDNIYLSKPLGTGIVTTAAKFNACPTEVLEQAIASMSTLNKLASKKALESGSKCSTDVTGFGLAGHCYNVARASNVSIEIDAAALPIIDGVRELVTAGHTTAGANKTREFLGENLEFHADDDFYSHLVCDPQTSGGLAIFTQNKIDGLALIGKAVEGAPRIVVR